MLFRLQASNILDALPAAANAYRSGHKDIEAELCEETRKLAKQQKTLTEKYVN